VLIIQPHRDIAQPQVEIIPSHREYAQPQVVIFPTHREIKQPQVLAFQVFITDIVTTLETQLVRITQTTELFLMETLTILRGERGREHIGQSLQHPQIRDVILSSETDFRIAQVVIFQVF
jgi:hypothetical protein